MASDAYDFWLFDLDGTLVDVEWAYIRELFDRVGDRLGRQFTDREAERLWYGLDGERGPQLRAGGIDPTEFWAVFHDEEQPQKRAAATYLHDDAVALIDEIDAPMGVVTHCQPFLTEPVVEELDIADYFETIVCCDDNVGWKPDPTPVARAMAEMGVDADQQGVLVGDAQSDIGAAWNAGLDGVHIERHDPARRGRCVLGDYRVVSFEQLLVEKVATDGGTEK